MLTNIESLREFFGTPAKPVSTHELADLKKIDPAGFEELAAAARETLAREIPQVAVAPVGAYV